MSVVADTIFPVFALIALGYALGARRGFDLATLADLSLLVTSPALVFSVLAPMEPDADQLAVLVGGTFWIVVGTALLSLAVLGRAVRQRRGLLLPAIYWNAGNMALPCARLAYGPEGLAAASIIFVTMAMLQFSTGVWIAKGENGFAEMLRLPLIWAAIAGLVVALGEIPIPQRLMEPVEMLGAMAIPIMLLNLGLQLRTLRVDDLRHALLAVALRMGAGPVLALLFVALFAVEGIDRKVLLLESVMPAAVINVVMAQRYGTNPSLVASAIVVGTLLSLFAIPAVLLLAG